MIQSCNWQLLNEADYEDFYSLKKLLVKYCRLEKDAKRGDSVAAAIWVDLKIAIYESDPRLSEKQLEVVELICLHYMPQEEVARELEIHQSRVSRRFDAAVRKIKKKLDKKTNF